jgi:hypothetical protein
MALSVALGWAILGATVGLSGGLMIRSRERTFYGFIGGALGGLFGGALFYELSATSLWSALAGLMLLGMSIGGFISLVEEAFVSATLKVVKGRHLGGLSLPEGRTWWAGTLLRCLSFRRGRRGLEHAVIKQNKGRFSIETDEQGKAVYVKRNDPQRQSRRQDIVAWAAFFCCSPLLAGCRQAARKPRQWRYIADRPHGTAGMEWQPDGQAASLQIRRSIWLFRRSRLMSRCLTRTASRSGTAKEQVKLTENNHASRSTAADVQDERPSRSAQPCDRGGPERIHDR